MKNYTDEDIYCPITGEIFFDPVTTECQHHFENASISAWFFGGHHTCPCCRQRITRPGEPNSELKLFVRGHLSQQPEKLGSLFIPTHLVECDVYDFSHHLFFDLLRAQPQRLQTEWADITYPTFLYYLLKRFGIETIKDELKTIKLDINHKNKHGQTTLFIATQFHEIEIVKFLLSRPKIDVLSRTNAGNCAFDVSLGVHGLSDLFSSGALMERALAASDKLDYQTAAQFMIGMFAKENNETAFIHRKLDWMGCTSHYDGIWAELMMIGVDLLPNEVLGELLSNALEHKREALIHDLIFQAVKQNKLSLLTTINHYCPQQIDWNKTQSSTGNSLLHFVFQYTSDTTWVWYLLLQPNINLMPLNYGGRYPLDLGIKFKKYELVKYFLGMSPKLTENQCDHIQDKAIKYAKLQRYTNIMYLVLFYQQIMDYLNTGTLKTSAYCVISVINQGTALILKDAFYCLENKFPPKTVECAKFIFLKIFLELNQNHLHCSATELTRYTRELTQSFNYAHQLRDKPWQRQICNAAFNALMDGIQPQNLVSVPGNDHEGNHPRGLLQWARKQTFFNQHKGVFGIGRTKAVVVIDEMMKHIYCA